MVTRFVLQSCFGHYSSLHFHTHFWITLSILNNYLMFWLGLCQSFKPIWWKLANLLIYIFSFAFFCCLCHLNNFQHMQSGNNCQIHGYVVGFVLFCFLFIFVFWDTVWLCSWGWLWIDKFLASTSQVLEYMHGLPHQAVFSAFCWCYAL